MCVHFALSSLLPCCVALGRPGAAQVACVVRVRALFVMSA
jgi:hypothetical protein